MKKKIICRNHIVNGNLIDVKIYEDFHDKSFSRFLKISYLNSFITTGKLYLLYLI